MQQAPTEVALAGAPVKPRNDSYDILVHSDERERWLQIREQGIGASESASIMGLNPYSSAFAVYARRTGLIAPHEVGNRFTSWGNRLEPVVAQAFADESGRSVERNGWICKSRRYPWLLATPDYDQQDGDRHGLLECKTADKHFREEWEKDIPVHYQCQLQHQLLVLGEPFGSVACLVGGNSFHWADQEAHQRFQRALAKRTQWFARALRGKAEAPVPDDHPATSAVLQQMLDSGAVVQLPDVVLAWHEESLRYAAQERDAKERKDEYRRMIKAAIGDARYGILPNRRGLYTFKTTEVPEKVVAAHRERRLSYSKKTEVPKED